ncbi:MAG: hypothetical protein GY870_06845, partial [archaeon]|nr:hypothetical protein [archaeon]
MQDRIGHYSRNIRLDVSKFKEHDPDDGKRAQKWKNGKKKPRNVDKKIKNYKKKISKTTDPEKIQVHMVGESHIDIAWRWRLAQTHRKAYVTFKKAVYHSKKFPDTYNFALSEPLLLDWIKEEEPELFKEIQDCVKAGNIELVGGSYVEPDCMMPSGESFVRERLYGMRFYKNNFNYLPNVEWFLDSFGYNYGLPQILSKSGAKYFWTTKITWNIQTTFPFVNFWWEGPDGTRLLTSNFGMGTHPLVSWEKFQSGRRLLRENGKKVWNYTDDYSELINHVSEEFCPHVGCFFGKGDGGHGPTYKETVVANERDKSNL